jgi:hypothetical protein
MYESPEKSDPEELRRICLKLKKKQTRLEQIEPDIHTLKGQIDEILLVIEEFEGSSATITVDTKDICEDV